MDGSNIFKISDVEAYMKERMAQYDALPREVRDKIKYGRGN